MIWMDVHDMELTIAQFDYVLYYLPLYIAKEKFLPNTGLELTLLCTGNDDSALEAICEKRAEVALSDPSMAALFTQAGKPCRVIGQMAHYAPIHLITLNQLYEPAPLYKLAALLRGKRLSTYPKPSTTYLCTCALLRRLGLTPEKDVELVQTPYREELGPLFSAEVDFAMVNDPIFTQAIGNGAKTLHYLKEDFGPMTFSGLSVRAGFGKKGQEKKELEVLMQGVQKGMELVFKEPQMALEVAKAYFPRIEEKYLKKSIDELVMQNIFTKNLRVPKADWEGLVKLRMESGELTERRFSEIVD